MAIRTKGRAKFDFRGRAFVWWTDRDFFLRIASADKKFVIAIPLGTVLEEPQVVEVIGHEFPGVDPREPRPLWLVAPDINTGSVGMGGWVEKLLIWAFDTDRERVRVDRRPKFA